MTEFVKRLNEVSDSYYGFVVAVLTYVKKNQSRYCSVERFMDENPNALSSDILEFISSQDDFYDDGVYGQAQVG